MNGLCPVTSYWDNSGVRSKAGREDPLSRRDARAAPNRGRYRPLGLRGDARFSAFLVDRNGFERSVGSVDRR
jgi:hypothetical protein